MSNESKPLHLFEAFGVELEYMIVHTGDLKVSPVTDKLIFDVLGEFASDVEIGEIAWSNELVLHVIELKTNGPAADLDGLAAKFQGEIKKINALLAKYNAKLLPTGAHPFMDPFTETCLWPHDHNVVYEAYNRIFDCRGHGWSNLQSTHLNLPFSGDTEFAKLHAAIRLLLPILPALCASSPIMDGAYTGFEDSRLEVYRSNQAKIPSIAGEVIPEQVFSRHDYETRIFGKIYQDIAPYDPEEILQNEFLNSRGAIARFDRNTIEIRIIDIQECPQVDLAIVQAVVQTLRALTEEKWQHLENQQSWHETDLAIIFREVIKTGQQTIINNKAYLHMFGYKNWDNCTVQELWRHIFNEVFPGGPEEENPVHQCLKVILEHGNLAHRIKAELGAEPTEKEIINLYQRLSKCLASGQMFMPENV